MGQWSELLGDLLDMIEGGLISYRDKIRVRAVCVSWNSHLPKVRIPIPRLLQAFESKSNPTHPTHPTHGLYNLLEKKFDLLDLPELQGKLFKGSCYGWVVAVDDSPGRSSPDIFLINPLTKVKIELPPRYTFPDVIEYNVDRVDEEYTLVFVDDEPYFHPSNGVHLGLIQKVVMSSPDPSSEDCVLVAIYGSFGRLAWCKPNDKSWTALYGDKPPFTDVLFLKGRLHALNQRELIIVDDIGGPNQKITKIVPIPLDGAAYNTHLAESSDGELLMVGQHRDECEDIDLDGHHCLRTEAFKLYKRDPSLDFVETNDIGDDMLFVGLNSSLSISSHKFPGWRGNCIYFTPLDFYVKGSDDIHSDLGVFSMEDGSIESLPGFRCVPRHLWPPPIWY